jgi:hypothetical protein
MAFVNCGSCASNEKPLTSTADQMTGQSNDRPGGAWGERVLSAMREIEDFEGRDEFRLGHLRENVLEIDSLEEGVAARLLEPEPARGVVFEKANDEGLRNAVNLGEKRHIAMSDPFEETCAALVAEGRLPARRLIEEDRS